MKRILLVCMAVTCLFSCSKKESNKTSDPPIDGKELSALEKKVVGKWQFVSSIDSNTVFNPARITDAMVECEKNDVYTFTTDKTFTIDEGATICGYPVGGGAWRISTTQIDNIDVNSFEASIVSGGGYSYPVLTFIDDTRMVLRSRDNSGKVYTVNTYRKL